MNAVTRETTPRRRHLKDAAESDRPLQIVVCSRNAGDRTVYTRFCSGAVLTLGSDDATIDVRGVIECVRKYMEQ